MLPGDVRTEHEASGVCAEHEVMNICRIFMLLPILLMGRLLKDARIRIRRKTKNEKEDVWVGPQHLQRGTGR